MDLRWQTSNTFTRDCIPSPASIPARYLVDTDERAYVSLLWAKDWSSTEDSKWDGPEAA